MHIKMYVFLRNFRQIKLPVLDAHGAQITRLYLKYNALYYPVDISTTVFSYSRAVQYHAILHGTGVIARVLLHGPWGYAVS